MCAVGNGDAEGVHCVHRDEAAAWKPMSHVVAASRDRVSFRDASGALCYEVSTRVSFFSIISHTPILCTRLGALGVLGLLGDRVFSISVLVFRFP